MDEFTVDAFVNRDDPIPVISFDGDDDLSDERPQTPERRRDKFMQHGKNMRDNLKGTATETTSSMQDRLLEKQANHPLGSSLY